MTFDEFLAARLPALLRYAVMLTGDPHLAEDVVQETMVRAHAEWGRVSRADVPDRYVKRMVTNTYLGWRRRAWFHRSVPVAELPERAIPDPAESSVVRQELWARLGKLPARQRAAVVLRYYEDLDDASIAEILGCSLSTVRSLVFRAIEELRRTTDSVMPTGRKGGAR
ncbi:SigE family RNA polymerase sigma factor [Dactylosporangium aurantiacum]|uniref:SigE family RNA polymerase sigma factor n=1 Tax=Dactylosporangium aurantiacum TaxID=35754 RepID=A0A9Q9IN06_9ACTN|nr:SigE family RNA polymerase sigma factor [Dactylosporangium aurantiacum]MDG6108310.1 SigE family RNA polymerase sigma factor [Dactylosporangium aurantiacum]UWZ58501.1 SigE family RNA polymerase sigma factor [Dactylosporangium aurantiacum]